MKTRDYSERLTIAAEQNLKERDFWKKQLSGEPGRSSFPYDIKNSPPASGIGTVGFQITGEKEPGLYTQLSAISKGSEYTLNLVFVAALMLLLHKYTGRTDILVGMPIYKQETEGDFINTVLVIRNPVEKHMTFKELLLQVRQTITEAEENQNYPMEILADQLGMEKPGKGFPLFDVAILLENIQEKKYLQHIETAVTFCLRKQPDEISGRVEYNRCLYEKETQERIVEHYIHILRQVLGNVDGRHAEVKLVTAEEEKQLLYDFNSTAREKPGEKLVHQWYREQVEKGPDKIAAAGGDTSKEAKQITYRQINERAGQLAGALREKGVRPGRIVGLKLGRTLEIPGGILGILEAGCAYMPIDPEFPGERIEYMLRDSDAAALVTARDLNEESNKINWEGEKILLEDHSVPSATSVVKSPPEALNSSEGQHIHHSSFITHHSGNLAYVIYTSGTTGQPKGVLVRHRNLVNYVNWFTRAAGLTGRDKTILTSSFAFDLGYTSLYPSILKGGELHILPREIYLLGERLLGYIEEKGITYLKVTPSLFSVIVRSPNYTGEVTRTLRLVVIGGEAIHVEDVEKSYTLCPAVRVMNHYGPTEATIGSVATMIDFQRYEVFKERPVIGKPVDNAAVYIMNKESELLPVGVPGELCIAGAGIARGYLNRPELTAEKFCTFLGGALFEKTAPPHPPRKNFLLNMPEGRLHLTLNTKHLTLYKTGDLARRQPDGTIEFLGRNDAQVKIMGYRVEMGEIQSRLQKYKDVENVYLEVREAAGNHTGNGGGDKYICAYIVPREGKIKTREPGKSPADKILTLKEIAKEGKFAVPPSGTLGKGGSGTQGTIVSHFREVVENNRDKVAVISGEEKLTYGDLDRLSRQAAIKIEEEYDDRYGLSKSERVRYKRQMLLHGWGIASQEKLKSTTVFVAGAGGGASPTIMQLALAGFGTIIVCDFDEVELSNLNRQFLHDETRLGMNKAQSAKMTIARVNPHVKVIPRTEKLTAENAAELVGDAAAIFDMFDGLEGKFILSEYALARGIPHFISAMSDINGYSAVFYPPKTPCFHCIFDRKKWETIVAGMGNYMEHYEKNPLPVAATSLFMSTAFAVNEAIKIVLGFGEPAYNRFIFFNQRGSEELADTPGFQATTHAFSEHFRDISREQGFDWEIGWRGHFIEELTITPDPGCPYCGKKAGENRENHEKPGKKVMPTPVEVDDKKESNPKDKRETIAVLLSHDIRKAVGMMGAVKSGKIYVPLDPAQPVEKLCAVLEDSESRVILTDGRYQDQAEKLRKKVNPNIKIIEIDRLSQASDPGEETGRKEPGSEIEPGQIVYRIYSPGPAPNPGKYIQESHKDILDFIRDYRYNKTIHPGMKEKISSNSSCGYSFEAAMADFYTVMISGAGPYRFENSNTPVEPGEFTREIREYLRGQVPDYMVPAHFVLLDKIPQTPNGKVDRKALPEPGSSGAGESIVTPRNAVEQELAALWSQILEVEKDRVSINSNFFELGGNSLKATILSSKIHKEFDVRVPLGEIFKAPQIKSLSVYISGLEKEKFIAIEPAQEKPYYSLSSAQKRLYILHMMDEKGTRFNMFRAFRMIGTLDRDRVEAIFRQLIQRHESFRTSFEMKESEPVQVIHRQVEFSIDYFDWTDQGEAGPGTGSERDISREFLRSFDLTRPPLLRVGLVKLPGNESLLVLDLHHIISDGTSMRKLEREFIRLYAGDTLPGLKLQYRDFSEWQNRLFETGAIRKQKEYWHDRYKGEIPVLKMPHDYPRPPVLTAEGSAVGFEIDPGTTAAVKRLVAETETTLFMVLMAVFNILLLKYTGQEDIVVGTPIIGRRHADLEDIIGLFVNMLALRNRPQREKTFEGFLREVKTAAFEANENQDYQFEQLVWDLNLKADYGRYPLFDAVFVLNMEEVGKVEVRNREEIDKLQVLPYQVRNEQLHHEFLLNATEQPRTIIMELQYSTQLYKETTARKMTAHYLEILKQVTENRRIKLEEITVTQELIAAASLEPQEDEGDFRL